MIVGVDADVGGDLHSLPGDFFGAQLLSADQRAGRGQRVIPSGSDTDEPVVRLQNITGPAQNQRDLAVGDGHHGFETAKVAIRAPVLGEFHTGACELGRVLLQFGLQSFEQGEGVGRRTGEPADDGAVSQTADLPRRGLDDGVAH